MKDGNIYHCCDKMAADHHIFGNTLTSIVFSGGTYLDENALTIFVSVALYVCMCLSVSVCLSVCQVQTDVITARSRTYSYLRRPVTAALRPTEQPLCQPISWLALCPHVRYIKKNTISPPYYALWSVISSNGGTDLSGEEQPNKGTKQRPPVRRRRCMLGGVRGTETR